MGARSILCGLLLGGGLLGFGAPGLAFSVSYDFTGADWTTSDITGVGGNESWANDGALSPPTRLRLTSAAGGQQGAAWLQTSPGSPLHTAAIDAGQAWNAEFTWQITFEGGGGADGLAFHISDAGFVNTNFEGGSLTSGGLPSHLTVGIDTWNNGGEPDFHLQVHHNGSQVGGNVDLSGLGPVSNDVYQVVMSYDGAGNLTVNVVNTANTNQTGNQNYSVNLAGLNGAAVGWSANTGGSVENHDIRTFSGTFLVPEPTTGLLLGLGLAGLARSGRRRA